MLAATDRSPPPVLTCSHSRSRVPNSHQARAAPRGRQSMSHKLTRVQPPRPSGMLGTTRSTPRHIETQTPRADNRDDTAPSQPPLKGSSQKLWVGTLTGGATIAGETRDSSTAPLVGPLAPDQGTLCPFSPATSAPMLATEGANPRLPEVRPTARHLLVDGGI